MNDSPPASQTRKVVTCGDAAADMVVAAGLAAPEDLLVLHDVLSVGPLAGCRQARSWVPGREAFWSRVGRAPASFPDKPRDLFTALAGRHPPSELVLAGACGASDVLFLAAVPAWLRLQGGTAPRLSLVRLTRSPEGEVLQSLPWLRPETLRAGWSPKPLSERFTQVLDQAWIAVTDPEPLRIAALATARDHGDMEGAFQRLVARFPAADSGLGAWDQCLLAQVAAGAKTVFECLGRAMRVPGLQLDPVGDSYLWHRLECLSDPRLPAPPLVLESRDERNREAGLRITAEGQAMLDGRLSHLLANRQTEPVCGVAQDPDQGGCWVRDAGGQLVEQVL